MKQLFMKQMVSKGKSKFSIKNRRGEGMYTVVVDESDNDTLLQIVGADRESVLFVKQNLLDDTWRFSIESDDKIEFVLKHEAGLLDFVDHSEELSVNGNMLDMHFDVMLGYRKVGKIRKRWISTENSYELTVFEEDREAALIGLMAVLDFAMCCDVLNLAK